MAGRVYLRNKTYWIALSYKGKEYRRSALTNKKREADNLLGFYLGQVARGEFRGFNEKTEAYTGLDHGVGHFRPLSITRHRHLLTYPGTAMSHEGLCQVF